VPTLGSGYAAPSSRTCARCGCRLSRYSGMTERYCAPCATVIHPYVKPELRTPLGELERRREAWHRNASNQCECGAYKSQGAQTCVKCYIQRISNKDPWHGPVCACGGHKAIDARMCKYCRYPSLRR